MKENIIQRMIATKLDIPKIEAITIIPILKDILKEIEKKDAYKINLRRS